MRKFLLIAITMLSSVLVSAQENPLWMRYNAISPDGTTIAFCYKGDIYTVPVDGGRANQITSNPAQETMPIWSPNSKKIAFASNRNGSYDIFVVNKEGGAPKRLTTNSASETPVVFADNNTILFSANIMPSAEDAQFPSGTFKQVYKVNLKAERPIMVSSMPMEAISINANGKMLYHNKKGYENLWRKHHTSSVTRDIWSYNPKKDEYKKITNFKGEDRSPIWNDNNSFYYLSEKNGSFNVYLSDLNNRSVRQITKYKKNPVRFLSLAKNGTLCYGYNGEIFTMSNGKTSKVKVQIFSDSSDKELVKSLKSFGATDIAVSPKNNEVAFIYHGDVYVTSVEYNTTKQITDTPYQERNIDFSPDGRSIIYSSERNDLWQIYRTTIKRKEEKEFAYATEFKEERLTKSNQTSFQPLYSPDGKEVAFLENRTTIKVMNLNNKRVRTVMDGKFEYSYTDGDQWYQWSPDSKWILTNYIGIGGWNNKDVALVKADGSKEIHNLTLSGYSDTRAKFVLGGKAIIWSSDRAGYRSHGSWGAESDCYIMFFDVDACEKFLMSKEDLARYEKREKEKAKEKAAAEAKDKKKSKKSKKKNKKSKKDSLLKFDFENCQDRVVRLTRNSSFMGDYALSPKGDKLYYLAAFEGGYDLWVNDLKTFQTRILIKGAGSGSLNLNKSGKYIYMCTSGRLKRLDVNSGKTKPISFAANFNYKPYQEREYIFNHIWKQVNDKFYRTDIHGIDWKGYKNNYKKFLPYINNNIDFAEMLSEMLGELNASHTGAMSPSTYGAFYPTAELGVFLNDKYEGKGLQIKEIIKRGPFTLRKNDVTPGCIIEKIDGNEIKKGQDYYPLLEGKVGKKVLLSIYNPATKKRFETKITAVSHDGLTNLLYRRWTDRCRDKVEKLSNGKVGYVHIKGMDSPSFRRLYSDLLGRYRNVDAVIIDTRHNGGGWLHDDVVTLLSGKKYQEFAPRGRYIGSDPFNKWLKPSCMLICEDNYSNAHGTPWVYKTLGIGKLIGAPVPGTMTAVWWEKQINPNIIFGVPQVGCRDMNGQYLENVELEPDILIYNDPKKMLRGEDEQIEAAVKEMLKEIKK